MALNKQNLKNNIVQLMSDMMTREEISIEEFAARLSNAIDVYIKEATIVYSSGLSAPNGVVTGMFNGNLI